MYLAGEGMLKFLLIQIGAAKLVQNCVFCNSALTRFISFVHKVEHIASNAARCI